MKKDRTGERKLMNNGQWAEIIEYNDYHNIVIQFEDGTIVNKSSYLRFTEGKIENPNDMVYGKIGEERIMNNGLKAKIIEVYNYRNITVEFEDGYIIRNRTYSNFVRGTIKNPYAKKTFGIGYSGNYEDYNSKAHSVWIAMLGRCYKTTDKAYKNYGAIGVKVCEEWKCFANFQKWYNENIYEIENEKVHLDKDILVDGNNIYSPETCIFVPQRINKMFETKKSNLPRGVRQNKSKTKYCATIRVYKDGESEQINLGTFDTIELAEKTYNNARSIIIKNTAEEYKDKIPKKLYDRLIEISNNLR